MEITWLYLLIGIAILLLIVGALTGASKKRKGLFTWAFIIGIVAILLALVYPAINTPINFGGGLSTTPVTVTTPSPVTKVCAVEDTTVTLATTNKYTAAATSGTHRYRINGGPALTVSDASTFTASPNDVIEILWYNASTSGGYFSDVSTVTVPCAGTKTFSNELVQNGTVSVQVFNEEGNVIDGTTENETLAAGDVVTLKAEIRGTYQKGMPFGGLMIVEFNTTEIDDVIVDFGDTTPVPISAQFKTVAATDHAVKAYKIPAILSNQLLTGTVVIDADDSTNPGSADDIDLQLEGYNYFINDDKGGAFELGVEDEDNTATEPTNSITFTLATD